MEKDFLTKLKSYYIHCNETSIKKKKKIWEAPGWILNLDIEIHLWIGGHGQEWKFVIPQKSWVV